MDPALLLCLVLGVVGAQTLSAVRARKGSIGELLACYRRCGFGAYLRAPLYLGGFVMVAMFLAELEVPLLHLSWLQLLDQPGQNLIVPVAQVDSPSIRETHPWLPLVSLGIYPLLGLAMPVFVEAEERTFRARANSTRQAVWHNLGFGFVHMIVGVPVWAALTLAMLGGVFTLRYRSGFRRALACSGDPRIAREAGVRTAAAEHLAYNTVIVALAATVHTILVFR